MLKKASDAVSGTNILRDFFCNLFRLNKSMTFCPLALRRTQQSDLEHGVRCVRTGESNKTMKPRRPLHHLKSLH